MQWVQFRHADGSSDFQNVRTGKCIDIANASPFDGAVVQQYRCTDNNPPDRNAFA